MARIESALLHLGNLDELARRDSPATRLDPRVKVVATAVFVGVVATFGRHDLGRLAPLVLFPIALATLGDVPWRPVAIRLALASPFAIGVAAFELFFDRAPALTVGPVVVTGGALAFATVLAKLLLSLGAALLLVATTGFSEVCLALRRLAVPRVLISQLLFTYRYLFVLADEAARMARASSLRSPAKRRLSLQVIGTLLGQLLLRALSRAERIHVAMRCRGFRGELPMCRPWALRSSDIAFACSTALLLVVTRAVDLPAMLAPIVTRVLP